MAKLTVERKVTSEDPNYKPGREWKKYAALGGGAFVAWFVISNIGHADSKSYTVTSTEAACDVVYVGTLTAIDGHTVSAEVSIACKNPPATMKFTVRLQHRDKPSQPWKDVGTAGVFNSPPDKLTPTVYEYAAAPCQVGDFQAVYTLSGTGKASGVKFDYAPTASSTRTVKDGECR